MIRSLLNPLSYDIMKILILFFTLCIATLGISRPSNPILLLDAINATSSSWTDGSASSNTAVASVDQTGLVTAITLGSTNITYTLCEAQATYSLVVPEQNSFSFDGSNDYADVTDVTLGTVSGDFTIEAWINIDVNQNGEIFMRNTDGGGASQVHYGLRYRDGDLMLHLGTGLGSSSYYAVKTANTIPTGEWIHVAGVFNAGTGATLYVNGVAQTTDAPNTNSNSSINYGSSGTGINTIGKFRTLSGDYNPYDGRIDELRIWNVARTASEIQSNMGNQIDPSSSDLVAYYRFNNGTRNVTNSGVTTLSDLTGNGNDATIGSSSLTGTASNWVTGFIPPITGNATTTVGSTTQLANAASGGTWSSSNTGVATVDQTGLVTGVSIGSSTISYTKDGNTASTTLTVFDPSNAGPITIVASGGGTEGTHWVKAGNELFANSTSAVSVNASDIVSYAAAGDLVIHGASIAINTDLNTASTYDLTFKSKEDIDVNSNSDITTNGGSVVFWSNSDGAASFGSTIFYPNSSVTTNGGHLWIGGGSGSTMWNSLSVGDGYAVGGTTIDPVSNGSVEAGVYFESSSLSTNGGTIHISGSGKITDSYGMVGIGVVDIDAGSGTVDIDILTNGSGYRGVSVGHHHSAIPGNFALRSTNSASDAISFQIDATGAASHAIVTGGTVVLENTGTGGVELVTTAPSGQYGIRPGYSTTISTDIQLLAASGPIVLNTNTSPIDKENNNCFITIGSKSGSNVTSSSSDITITTSDLDDQFAATLNTSGSVTVQPKSGNSFSTGASTGFLTLANTVSEYIVGSATNTSDITIGSTTTIAGPIVVYGGAVAVNADVTTTQGGDFSLDGNNISVSSNLSLAGNLKAFGQTNLTIAANKSITSTGGDIILWSDYDADNNGYISVGDNISLTTSGGDIVLAGGSDTDSDGIPDGFAKSSTTHGVTLGTTINNTTTIASSGGDIIIKGECSSTTTQTGHGVQQTGLFDIDAGAGSVIIEGVSANWYGIDFAELISASSTPWTIKSSATTGAAITIKGTTTGTSQYGVVFNWPVQKQLISDAGGSISITGTGTSGQWGIFSQNVDYLSSSGAITLDGGVYGIKVTDTGSRFGALSGSDVTSSSAPVTLKGDIISIADWANGSSTTVLTSGTISIQPSTTSSFGSGIIWPAGTATSGWNLGKTSGNSTTIFDWESITVN